MLYVNPQTQSSFKAMELSPGAKGRETEALKQFEQLFLFQMLKEMRRTVPDYGFFESGGQKAYFEEMMDDVVAGEMAASGQLGVADQMAKQLHETGDNGPLSRGVGDSRGIPLAAGPGWAQSGLPLPEAPTGIPIKAPLEVGISLGRAQAVYRVHQ